MNKNDTDELFQEEGPKMNHACRTYFAVYGVSRAEDFLRELGIPDGKASAKGGKIYIGYNEKYNTDINEMIRETLSEIFGKAEILKNLKAKFSAEYYLALIPEIISASGEPKQILSLSEDVIEFLYLSKTKIDLDYYVY